MVDFFVFLFFFFNKAEANVYLKIKSETHIVTNESTDNLIKLKEDYNKQ